MSTQKFIEQFGYLFYVVSPNKTSYETVQEVPDYVVQVIPHFVILVFLEYFILLYQKRPTTRINDAFGSIAQGLLLQLSKVATFSAQMVTYIYVYNHWRLVTLPWNSLWTWWLCFLGVDLAYYWLHRASHEINILWAAHQVHHSSEDYNLSTALRQSVFQNFGTWIFNLPMALAIPPSVFLVHLEFNLLYQFWIHTEIITSLGPLEYILNTASHHRVHHGRNRYCIDKNYAGTLIIWDRMFGTFQPEEEKVVYGLTHPINTFESFYIQFAHYIHICKTFLETKGLRNKLSVMCKGPGWSPGTPWYGNIEDIPDVKAPVEKYDPPIPMFYKAYVFVHSIILLIIYLVLATNKKVLSQQIVWSIVSFEVCSISSLGMILDGRFYAPWIELLRCILYILIEYFLLHHTIIYTLVLHQQMWLNRIFSVVFIASFVYWIAHFLMSIRVKLHTNKMTKRN